MDEKEHVKREKERIFLRKFTAMAIGNMMEWFDFSAFGALVDIIALNFFPPSESHVFQLMQSLAFFGVAFVMRPLGGILMGYIGDKINRKRALEVSILMMFIPSLLIGVLPTYAHIGIYSYLILLLLRMIQGLAAGGEMIGAFLYTLESCNGRDVGFWGGACKASGNFGTALGVGLVTVLRSMLSEEEMLRWGWRVPFLCSLLFGVAGLVARMTLKEDENDDLNHDEQYALVRHALHSPSQQRDVPHSSSSPTAAALHNSRSIAVDPQRSPMSQVMEEYSREVMVILLASAFWACTFYTGFVWLVYFMQDPELIGGDGVSTAWRIAFIANICLVVALPVGGSIGDFFGDSLNDPARGCRLAMQIACVLMIFLSIPAFLLIITRESGYALFGQFLLLVPVFLYGANLPFFMMSMIDSKKLRYTAMGIGYNLSHAIFSSTTSVIQTTLVLTNLLSKDSENRENGVYHSRIVIDDPRLRPAFYLIFISLLALFTLTRGVNSCEQHRQSLRSEQYAEVSKTLQESINHEVTPPEAMVQQQRQQHQQYQLQQQRDVEMMSRRSATSYRQINVAPASNKHQV